MSVPTLRHLARSFATCCIVIAALGAGRTCFAGHAKADEGPTHAESAEVKGGENSSVKGSGIELGQFKIRSDYPAEAQKCTVRFVLYAAIKPEQFDAMQQLVKQHQTKLRDEIIIATRLTPLGVFEEPTLATFRRRIMIRLRRTLPELAVEELYISDFGLMVKSL